MLATVYFLMRALACDLPHEASKEFLIDYFHVFRIFQVYLHVIIILFFSILLWLLCLTLKLIWILFVVIVVVNNVSKSSNTTTLFIGYNN